MSANTTAEINNQTTSLLDHIGTILDLSKENGIDDDFFDRAKPNLEFVANRLDVSIIQAALFAKIVDISIVNPFHGENELFNTLKCTKSKYLKYMNEIDELTRWHYVIKTMNDQSFPRYRIPRDVLLALRKGDTIRPVNYKNISIEKFFLRTDFIFESCCKDELTAEETADEINSLIQNNTHLDFVQKILSQKINENEQLLLIFFFSQCIDDDGEVSINYLEKLFPNDSSIINQVKNQDNILQKLEFIENDNDNGFAIKEKYKLTEKAKEKFLSGIRNKAALNKKGFIFSKDIKEKQMYYNSREDEQIRKLENLLLPVNLENVTERLLHSGLRIGFTCLFSGPPGTGKTETVYQIAHKTGRDLMVVDISEIRSMWVGESEKHIKAIFTRYREHVKISKNIPILFFNEADAIINSRMEFTEESSAVEKMENTLQNIILQELENLDGIIIATTNMTQNMDKAFERRFLYKIEFKKPEKQIRKMLWKSMISELNEEEAHELASRFDFSGGQIENIARKRTIDLVLYNFEHDLFKLISYCEEETMNQATKQQRELMNLLQWLSYLIFLRWAQKN